MSFKPTDGFLSRPRIQDIGTKAASDGKRAAPSASTIAQHGFLFSARSIKSFTFTTRGYFEVQIRRACTFETTLGEHDFTACRRSESLEMTMEWI